MLEEIKDIILKNKRHLSNITDSVMSKSRLNILYKINSNILDIDICDSYMYYIFSYYNIDGNHNIKQFQVKIMKINLSEENIINTFNKLIKKCTKYEKLKDIYNKRTSYMIEKSKNYIRENNIENYFKYSSYIINHHLNVNTELSEKYKYNIDRIKLNDFKIYLNVIAKNDKESISYYFEYIEKDKKLYLIKKDITYFYEKNMDKIIRSSLLEKLKK